MSSNVGYHFWVQVSKRISGQNCRAYAEVRGSVPLRCGTEAKAYNWLLNHAKEQGFTIIHHRLFKVVGGEPVKETNTLPVVATAKEKKDEAPAPSLANLKGLTPINFTGVYI